MLDVGSSSVRAWFYDREGDGLDPGTGASIPYRWRTGADGSMECGAEHLARLTAAAVDGAMAHARRARLQVRGVAMAALWHSLVGLDAAGEPVTPVYAWGDQRAARVALRLAAERDGPSLHQRTGCFLHPLYSSVKLAWLREEHPAAFAAARWWMSLPEYLEWRLLGARRCSVSLASGSGLLDVRRLDWDPEAMAIAGVAPEQLSPLVARAEPAYPLAPEVGRRWPELVGVPWFPALGDGACANVGSGAIGLERVGVTVGTTAAVRALWEPAGGVAIPPGLWCYRLDGTRWVAGSALSNGGNGIAFVRRTMLLPTEAEWEAEVARMDPDAHGLTVLPYLVGERGANWMRESAGALVGVTAATRPAQIMRAWMEALSYRIGDIFGSLSHGLGGSGEVRASGGAIHASPVWPQMLADVLDRPVAVSTEEEATARGAALVALEAMGELRDLRDAPQRTGERYRPDAARHAAYDRGMRRQQAVGEALGPWLGPRALAAAHEITLTTRTDV